MSSEHTFSRTRPSALLAFKVLSLPRATTKMSYEDVSIDEKFSLLFPALHEKLETITTSSTAVHAPPPVTIPFPVIPPITVPPTTTTTSTNNQDPATQTSWSTSSIVGDDIPTYTNPLSGTSISTVLTSTPVAVADVASDGLSSADKGAIAGSSLAATFLIATCVFWFRKLRRKRQVRRLKRSVRRISLPSDQASAERGGESF
ncbi:hypothetical protein F4778DRAFT_745342 [Xylariomycetidae sp. FL2044]|nr:hypothetical protein F4778DRAFT_745342 [Xylariomycetidae sp. FL2044]